MKNSVKVIGLILAAGLLFSCGNDKISHIEKINSEILEMMQDVYLWYSHLPSDVDPSDYSDPAEMMADIRYDVYDRWSTVITKEEYVQYFEEGEMVGYGFMFGLDDMGNFRIAFVYPATEAANKGVKRGWIMSAINGTTLTVNNYMDLLGDNSPGVTITFKDHENSDVTLELTKEVLELQPVVHSEVIERGDHKIGYMVFQDFIDVANTEIDTTISGFVSSGITELILDMRYNGGGSGDVALNLAGWLLGKANAGQPFIYYEHNDKRNKEPFNWDTMLTVPAKPNGLDLDRIFFIGTQNTASASEVIINGVSPFVESILAGSSTHGKPVGMYAIPIPINKPDFEYIAMPIAYRYTNKDHEGDFYDGISPDLPAEDDLTRDFGDPEEKSLKAILDYITSGDIPLKSAAAFEPKYIERKEPIGQFLKAF